MPPDPSTLLCESCGYPIEGLPAATACPECGTSAESSLPASRPGSPWQRRRGIVSLVRTNWAALRQPRDLFRTVRLDVRSGVALLAINLIIAATALLAPFSGILLDDPIRELRGASPSRFLYEAFLIVPLQVFAIALALLILTLIEWVGIQHFARRRGGRLCRLAAWQVVCHASVGWILAAACVMLSLVLWPTAAHFRWLPQLRGSIGSSLAGPALIPGVGAVAGLLVFESLVAIGVRRCRFANRPRGSVPA